MMETNGTGSVWKLVAMTAIGIIVGLIMAVVAGTGTQRQLDATNTRVTDLQVEIVKLQVEVARISEHLGVKTQ